MQWYQVPVHIAKEYRLAPGMVALWWNRLFLVGHVPFRQTLLNYKRPLIWWCIQRMSIKHMQAVDVAKTVYIAGNLAAVKGGQYTLQERALLKILESILDWARIWLKSKLASESAFLRTSPQYCYVIEKNVPGFVHVIRGTAQWLNGLMESYNCSVCNVSLSDTLNTCHELIMPQYGHMPQFKASEKEMICYCIVTEHKIWRLIFKPLDSKFFWSYLKEAYLIKTQEWCPWLIIGQGFIWQNEIG